MPYDHDSASPPRPTTAGHTRPRDDKLWVSAGVAEAYKHNAAYLDQQANEIRNGIHRTRLAADGDDYIEAVRRWDAREGDAFFKIAGHPDAHPRTTNLIWHYNHETDRAAVSLSTEDPLAIEWSPPPASNSLTV